MLGCFVWVYFKVWIEGCIGWNVELKEKIVLGYFDLVFVWDDGIVLDVERIVGLLFCWLGFVEEELLW